MPSGSGWVVDPQGAHVLTAAHCVAADGDPDETDDAAASIKRVGRVKTLIFANGRVVPAVCVASDEVSDVALMRICGDPSPHHLALMAREPPRGTPVVCVGNPYDWDLEAPDGAAPTPMGFRPFHLSAGTLIRTTATAAATGALGRQIHGAWTYWGHSGAPLVSPNGRIAGMHHAWNPENADRHAVHWTELASFAAIFIVLTMYLYIFVINFLISVKLILFVARWSFDAANETSPRGVFGSSVASFAGAIEASEKSSRKANIQR